MIVSKAHAATPPVLPERTQTVHKADVKPAQQDQHKQAQQTQATVETKKTVQPQTEKVQRGGEINITA